MKELEWFAVTNYDDCSNWSAREWYYAIEWRTYMRWLTTEQGASQLHYIIAHDIMGVPHGELGNAVVTDEDKRSYWLNSVKLLHSRGSKPQINEAHYANPENKHAYRAIRSVDVGYLGALYNDVIRKLGATSEQEEVIRGNQYSEEMQPMLSRTTDEIFEEAYPSHEAWSAQIVVTADLEVPDPVLIQHFLEEVHARRKQHGIQALPQVPNEIRFAQWHRNKVLGYFDICLYESTQGITFTDQQKGLALFPSEFDKSLDDKVRKTVRPLAASVFRASTLTALHTTSSDWFH